MNSFSSHNSSDAVKRDYFIAIDGASRGNPGESGVGIVIKKNGTVAQQHGFYIGKKTNNQAEYLALLCALLCIKDEVEKKDRIKIISDSLLLVRQLTGVYKVKSQDLRLFYAAACAIAAGMKIGISHVYREKNQVADRLANEGIDQKNFVPARFVDTLLSHGIRL